MNDRKLTSINTMSESLPRVDQSTSKIQDTKISSSSSETKTKSKTPDKLPNIKSIKSIEDPTSTEKVNISSKVWIKNNDFGEHLRRSDFKKQTEYIRLVNPGEIVVEGYVWTADKTQVTYHIPVGEVIIGEQLARVIHSRNLDFQVDQIVVCASGWRDRSLLDPSKDLVRKIRRTTHIPHSLFLGLLGHPGLMFYFCLFGVCQPKKGDILVVNGNRGFDFAMIGQMAKLAGCQVIACVTGQELLDFARSLKFWYVVNIGRLNSATVIRNMVPRGVDIYVDFLGAKFTHDILGCMRPTTRVVMLGDNAAYRAQIVGDVTQNPYRFISSINLRVKSHSVFDFISEFDNATQQMLEWVREDKLIYKTVLGGNSFDSLPTDLVRLLQGDTTTMIPPSAPPAKR